MTRRTRALSARPCIILHILDPRVLSYVATYDVSSSVCRALREGEPLRAVPPVPAAAKKILARERDPAEPHFQQSRAQAVGAAQGTFRWD